MAFLVYKSEKDDKGFRDFERVEKVSLAGKNSPIASLVNELSKKEGTTELRWHVSEGEILRRLNKSVDQHALIVDLKPSVENNVSLYHLKEIWGFSYDVWTPIAIRLETLAVDEYVQDPEKFKQKFNDEKSKREQVHEFLYLQGGTHGGSWSWGPVGTVNGALLWPEPLRYFIEMLSESLKAHKAI